jgi:hypothetical protein
MRANLHIEAQLNGTPFHYGRLLLSYEPCNGLRRSVDGDYRQHSNLPHVLLDPAMNNSGHLICPFISPRSWISLGEALGAQIGVLNIDTLVPLLSANGTIQDVDVNIYGWFTEVELSFPMEFTLATFTAQTSVVRRRRKGANTPGGKDEYHDEPNQGAISHASGAVAGVAASLSRIPVLAPAALAVETGARLSVALLLCLASVAPEI